MWRVVLAAIEGSLCRIYYGYFLKRMRGTIPGANCKANHVTAAYKETVNEVESHVQPLTF